MFQVDIIVLALLIMSTITLSYIILFLLMLITT